MKLFFEMPAVKTQKQQKVSELYRGCDKRFSVTSTQSGGISYCDSLYPIHGTPWNPCSCTVFQPACLWHEAKEPQGTFEQVGQPLNYTEKWWHRGMKRLQSLGAVPVA